MKRDVQIDHVVKKTDYLKKNIKKTGKYLFNILLIISVKKQQYTISFIVTRF